ncbi:hypothetical protein MATL_G00177630 [Megalops atlanticus]|uniref:Cysteine and tyrosine-rich protein 1 n=1 Tax=Megalops atlanticus TaxID=7932 RepID=A0A9D3SZQ0_MEGAT|nr:hypothetical protein MATL_G00177630 [Megalops atlanticus]
MGYSIRTLDRKCCPYLGCSSAQCHGCREYCCQGVPPFCCSYFVYMGSTLSGTAISGIVFGVMFLMVLVITAILCLCLRVKSGQRTVEEIRPSYITTVSHGCPGSTPANVIQPERDPPSAPPPPYSATPPRPANDSPPPPYPGNTER